MKITNISKSLLVTAFAVFTAGCESDDNTPMLPTEPTDARESVYALGLGVTSSANETNWYVADVEDLMTGTISVVGNGELQDGYRDFAFGGDTFYTTGGLGVTDVRNYSLNNDDELVSSDTQTFPLQIDDLKDVTGDGETMLGLSHPQNAGFGTDLTFYTIDIASNAQSSSATVPITAVYDTIRDWNFHTGMEVSGNKLYQTFYPVNNQTFVTQNTDTTYVAIYDYPALTLDTVITDNKFGPAGSFNTRNGIIKTENGDLYTISNSNLGYSQATKPAGIARILAGSTEFDDSYAFNTDTAANGGKITHALYIGNNKVFVMLSSKELIYTGDFEVDNWFLELNSRLAIVDLAAQTITLVEGAPEFTGDAGRSFNAFQDGNVVYNAIRGVDGVMNIYQTDIATATATKGAVVEATFVGGIARLK